MRYKFLGRKEARLRNEPNGARSIAICGLIRKLLLFKLSFKQFLIGFCDFLEHQNGEVEISSVPKRRL
jgi:hypothetical protein